MKMEFHVGDYLVQPHRNCVTCPDSSIRELKPEAMEVLTLLAEHQGQIVSKERILQTIWGSPWGTEDALTEAISDLKAIFEHAAGAPRFIQMVPQRGYCLTARVAVPESAGRYKVLQQIGEGATARVFLAHDAKLDRQVALKVLSTGALADEPMRRRFHNEARTLSKLNHQNIEIIHDVGTEGGCDFLVTEFIQGQTLRDKLAEGALPEAEIIRLACQLVDGLRAAHGQGVIHRDLKPSNMMLTLEGRLKIIDFGLAKTVRSGSQAQTGEQSRDRSTIVGTLPYMAPEQIRSGFVDIRSDIYAVGNVLYEMATGRRPFQEEPPSVLHLAIMGRRPLPPCKHRPALSRRLEKAILRCLKKDPADRWQTTEELLSALRHIESAAGKAKSEDGKDVWRIARLVSVPASALLAILAFLWIWPRPAPFPATAPFRVTMAAGWEGEPAISPDGSRVLYTSDAGGNLDVYWVDIRGGDPVQITDDDAVDKDPSWFPDGSNIAFASDRGGAWSIWKVSQSGGGATLLVPGAEHPAISPDGSRLAFAAVPGAGQHTRIGVAPLADPAEIRMLTHDGDGLWDHTHPAWSPDGRSVTYGCRHDLWTVPVEGGPAHRLTTDAEPESEPVYSPNGRYIYFSSERDGVPALWRVPATGGRAERITTSSVPESHPSISKDCRRLAYSSGGPLHHITLLDRQSGKETVLSDLESDIMAAIAPDNSRIVFPSQRHDTDINLWMQLLENGAPVGSPRRLTDHEGVASYPCFSPDGQWIAYYRVLGEARNIWIIPSSGGLPQQFTGTAATDVHPAWSNNGSAIAFVSDREGGYQVWAAAIENGRPAGNPRRLTDGETIPGSPHWSPDDSRISFIGRDAGSRDVYVVDVRQSRSARRLTRGADARQVRWDRATGSLLVSGTWDSGNLHIRAIAAEDGRFLNHLPAIDLGAGGASEAQGLFDVSADGSLLIFSRATRRGDIWVLEATTKGVF